MLRIGDRDLPDPLSLRRTRRIRLPADDHALGRDGDVSRDLGELARGLIGQPVVRPFAPDHPPWS